VQLDNTKVNYTALETLEKSFLNKCIICCQAIRQKKVIQDLPTTG